MVLAIWYVPGSAAGSQHARTLQSVCTFWPSGVWISLCWRAGAPLDTKPTLLWLTPSAICFLITCNADIDVLTICLPLGFVLDWLVNSSVPFREAQQVGSTGGKACGKGGWGEGRASTTLNCAKRVKGKAELARKGVTRMASMMQGAMTSHEILTAHRKSAVKGHGLICAKHAPVCPKPIALGIACE